MCSPAAKASSPGPLLPHPSLSFDEEEDFQPAQLRKETFESIDLVNQFARQRIGPHQPLVESEERSLCPQVSRGAIGSGFCKPIAIKVNSPSSIRTPSVCSSAASSCDSSNASTPLSSISVSSPSCATPQQMVFRSHASPISTTAPQLPIFHPAPIRSAIQIQVPVKVLKLDANGEVATEQIGHPSKRRRG